MTMMTCKECGGSVSTEAKNCPHCGYQIAPTWLEQFQSRVREVVGLTVLVLFALFVLGFAGFFVFALLTRHAP